MSASGVSSANFLTLNYNEIDRVTSFLDPRSIAALSCTCQRLYALTQVKVQRVYEELFKEKFGAIASEERAIASAATLYAVTCRSLELYRNYEHVAWDGQLNFSEILATPFVLLSVDHLSKTHSSSPAVQVYNPLECKPGSCNPLYHELVAIKMERMINYHKYVFSEFWEKPLNWMHPLQDLRDRCCRILTLEKTRKIYCLWAELHRIQQRAFLQQSATGTFPATFSEEIKFPNDDCIQFNDFVRIKRHYLSKRTIHHGGNSIKVSVSGGFAPVLLTPKEQITRNFDLETVFQIRNHDSDEILGAITFSKTWSLADQEEPPFLVNEYSDLHGRKIEPCFLTASQIVISNEKLTEDQQYLIYRLLAQIAVELLVRENFPALKVISESNHGGVFHAAGFRGDYHNTTILQQLREVREKENKLFIPFESLRKHNLWLLKPRDEDFGRLSLFNPRTMIYNSDGEHLHPVIVNFNTNTPPCFWEKIIYSGKGPLLGYDRGPVLPTYHHRDLTDHILPGSI